VSLNGKNMEQGEVTENNFIYKGDLMEPKGFKLACHQKKHFSGS
jgi:hypothetical protein